jgi:hypothetical protein
MRLKKTSWLPAALLRITNNKVRRKVQAGEWRVGLGGSMASARRMAGVSMLI